MKYVSTTIAIFVTGTALLANAPLLQAHGKNTHKDHSMAVIDTEQHPWGVASAATNSIRTIEVTMLDTMRFEPEAIAVEQGDVVRFVVANKGKLMHEFVIGTEQSLAEHARMMLKHPNMEHDAPYMAHIEPGKTGEIIWKFNRGGTFQFGCLIPGHFQAGMVGAIKVAAATNQSVIPSQETKSDAAPMLMAQADLADGEIKRVKKGSKKVTVKHGEIKNLQMPPMTMVFEAQDEAMLSDLKRGDKIKFKAIEKDGKMVITHIEAAGK